MSDRIERVSYAVLREQACDEIIDVRAPAEFAIDHLPGAINLPVLQDEERVMVGTLHKQQGPFDARRVGAGLVSANIAAHFRSHFAEKPRTYRPAVYCWRGGQRSRSIATVLAEVGWRTFVLDGGYKAYRRHIMEHLQTADQFEWRVINGFTGSGKTLILKALAEQGAQVIDLEGMANHKGSLFGGDLTEPQPSQKRFESLLSDQLSRYDRGLPIFIEAESPKIGFINISAPLWHAIRQAPVTEIRSPVEARSAYLLTDYQDWIAQPQRILDTIERLRPFHSNKQIEAWRTECRQGQWQALIASLLTEHYDRRYGVAGSGHYGAPENHYDLPNQEPRAIQACAEWLRETSKHP